MTLSAVLDDCLRRLQAGETVAACLADYREQADDLGPLLATAVRLRPLAEARLSDNQRALGRAAVRAAVRSQAVGAVHSDRRQAQSWTPRRAFGWMATAIVALLFLTLAGTTVLAAQPGDAGYALRVVAERVPAALYTSPGGRANAELRIADRRLADVESYLVAERRLEAVALAALVRSDEAAARRAVTLSASERTLIAERIERHARAIFRLAAQAETSQTTERLTLVARRMERIAAQLRLGLLLPERKSQVESTSAPDRGGPFSATRTATPAAPQETPGGQGTLPVTATLALDPLEPSTPGQVTPQVAEPGSLQPSATPAQTSTAPAEAGGTTTVQTGSTLASTSSATPGATVTQVARPRRTDRPPVTPLSTRPARPTITPQATRPPGPTITPRLTRTPLSTPMPLPTRTVRPHLTRTSTPSQLEATATPTAPEPRATAWPVVTPTTELAATLAPTEAPSTVPQLTQAPTGEPQPTPLATAEPQSTESPPAGAPPTSVPQPPVPPRPRPTRPH